MEDFTKAKGMIPAQRRRDILKQIAAHGSSTIAELSQRYGVSEMTIRRDLKALEEHGQIQYTHGGAVAVDGLQQEQRYAAKAQLNIAQKQRIAQYAAAHFVQDHAVIILESGTTVAAMVPYLSTKEHLTIVTNGLNTANALRGLLSTSTVISTGGILRDISFTFVGPVAEGFFQQFYARTLFLSGIGFTLDAGLTDPQMIDTQVKKAMIGAADRVVVLLDSSKFGVKSFTRVIQAGEIDVLITDAAAPAPILAELRRMGVDVHVVGSA
jgi:DeoR/GlpR family transcriptional regulator of sugar metabolism